MDCAEEVSLLRRELSRHEGVYDLSFDVLTGKMTVEFDAARIPAAGITRAVAATGMRCEAWREGVETGEPARTRSGATFNGLRLLRAVRG